MTIGGNTGSSHHLSTRLPNKDRFLQRVLGEETRQPIGNRSRVHRLEPMRRLRNHQFFGLGQPLLEQCMGLTENGCGLAAKY